MTFLRRTSIVRQAAVLTLSAVSLPGRFAVAQSCVSFTDLVYEPCPCEASEFSFSMAGEGPCPSTNATLALHVNVPIIISSVTVSPAGGANATFSEEGEMVSFALEDNSFESNNTVQFSLLLDTCANSSEIPPVGQNGSDDEVLHTISYSDNENNSPELDELMMLGSGAVFCDETPSPVMPVTPSPAGVGELTISPVAVSTSSPEAVDSTGTSAPSLGAGVDETLAPAVVEGGNDTTVVGAVGDEAMMELMDTHNAARCVHDAPDLVYSTDLAASAEEMAASASAECGTVDEAMNTGYGVNIAVCTGEDALASCAMETFYMAEVGGGPPENWGVHGLQVLWKPTVEMGCAVESCVQDSVQYDTVVCMYSPPADADIGDNVGDQVKTFQDCEFERS